MGVKGIHGVDRPLMWTVSIAETSLRACVASTFMEGISGWTVERTDTALGWCTICSRYSIAIALLELDLCRRNLYFARQVSLPLDGQGEGNAAKGSPQAFQGSAAAALVELPAAVATPEAANELLVKLGSRPAKMRLNVASSEAAEKLVTERCTPGRTSDVTLNSKSSFCART